MSGSQVNPRAPGWREPRAPPLAAGERERAPWERLYATPVGDAPRVAAVAAELHARVEAAMAPRAKCRPPRRAASAEPR